MTLLLIIVAVLVIGVNLGYLDGGPLNQYFQAPRENPIPREVIEFGTEESVVVNVVDKALASVVTISIAKTTSSGDVFEFNPFNPFSPFNVRPGQEETIEQNIGSGFVVEEDGLIITNRHVVADEDATYSIITSDNKTFPAEQIFRDPTNDLAIIRIDAAGLQTLTLGDSSSLKLGQLAIAIGTPLGEFRNTVTTGVISGIGRGITAGSPFENYVERLDNVIQTDAAINPGNSGGPLLNSAGEVIGINTAVSQSGQNIGFAIPVNVVKELLDNYRTSGGRISRPYLGIRYRVLSQDVAVMNDLPSGAYILEVMSGTSAATAGLRRDDVVLEIDGKKVSEENDIATIIKKKKVGDTMDLVVWRDGRRMNIELELGEY